MHTYDPFVLLHVASLWHLPGVTSHSSVSVVRLERNREKKGTKYQLKSFSVSIRESYELSNSQKPKFIWSFLFLVVLRWDLSIKVLLLSYPYCYYIKHTTCIWTALILPWKGVERKYTDDWAKKTMHTIKYNKKFSFGKIQHNIQWDKFTPLSARIVVIPALKIRKKISHIHHFKCWLRLIPVSQLSPSNPGGHKHRYPLSVNPDWQVALFSQ